MSDIALIEPELIYRIGAGDEGALVELYDRIAPVLLATAIRILHNTPEAEDVLQEVFVQIWGKASSFRSECGSPQSWLLRLTRNKSIERLRWSQKQADLLKKINSLAEAHATRPDNEQVVAGKDTSATLQAVMDVLSSDQRRVIEMAYFQGNTYQKIAEQLGEPLGTVKSRIRRALARLREHIQEAP